MKRIVFVALAIMASASFGTIAAKKKDKKQADKTEQVAPVVLVSSSDTLSYVTGKSLTNGLLPYLKQSFDVDTANIADFIRGFEEMMNGTNDSRLRAYAAGLSVAQQVSGRMLPNIRTQYTDTPDSVVEQLVYRGFVDALKNDTTHFSQTEAETIARNKSEWNKKAKEEKLYGPNRDAGRQFLAENAKKDSVVVLPSGLQYKVLVKGEGEVPQRTDKVLVNYEGKLVDGTVFDSSSKHGSKPASFRADQVIKGWTEALTMMPVGSKWQLFIPYELAYAERNMGTIKPFSALIFTVELVGIDKPQQAEAEKKDDTGKKAADLKSAAKAKKPAVRRKK